MKTWVMARRQGLAVIATAVLVASALAAGGVLAQTPPATATPTPTTTAPTTPAAAKPGPAAKAAAAQSAFLSKVAGKLGISQAQLTTAMKDAAKEMVDEAVQAGRIPREAADRMKERIDQGQPVFPRGVRPGHNGRPGLALGHLHTSMKELTAWLGMTPRELMDQMRAGNSLAKVAESKGKGRDQLITFLTDTFKKRLDQAVAAGKMTQARADQALERFQQHVGALVDRQMTPRGRGTGNG